MCKHATKAAGKTETETEKKREKERTRESAARENRARKWRMH